MSEGEIRGLRARGDCKTCGLRAAGDMTMVGSLMDILGDGPRLGAIIGEANGSLLLFLRLLLLLRFTVGFKAGEIILLSGLEWADGHSSDIIGNIASGRLGMLSTYPKSPPAALVTGDAVPLLEALDLPLNFMRDAGVAGARADGDAGAKDGCRACGDGAE